MKSYPIPMKDGQSSKQKPLPKEEWVVMRVTKQRVFQVALISYRLVRSLTKLKKEVKIKKKAKFVDKCDLLV